MKAIPEELVKGKGVGGESQQEQDAEKEKKFFKIVRFW